MMKGRPLLLTVAVVVSILGSNFANVHSGDKSHPVRLSDLQHYVEDMDRRGGWVREFGSLPPPTTQLRPWTYANTTQNIPKHRYPTPEDNLLTYDDTRVVLYRTAGDPYSDFIMANWVDSVRDRRRYIATQCPMESTISDFYRMVWQYNVHEIVMLASDHDIEKKKCWRYFLNNVGDSISYGEIEVELHRITQYPDITVRILAIKRGGSSRVVAHHHFTSWPDMGVPNDPEQLLNLIRKYRDSDTYTRNWPLLVHCVGGVGRTGTFILADSMMDMAGKEEQSLDFLKHFWTIRNQRISLIEKPEQYALAHRTVLAAYKKGLFTPQQTLTEVRDLPFTPQEPKNNTPATKERKKMNVLIVDPRMAEHDIVIRVTADENRCSA